MTTVSASSKSLQPALLAAGLLLSALPASAQLIFNGENTVSFVQETWAEGFLVGFGENQDGILNIDGSAVTSANNSRLADSDGTSSNNQTELHIRNFSLLEFSSDGAYSHFGYDGTALVTVEPESLLRTRRASVGTLLGSSGTVTLDGPNSVWNHSSFAVEIGRSGSGEVNVLNGGQISLAQNFVLGGQWTADLAQTGGTGVLNVSGPDTAINFANSNFARFVIGSGGTGIANVTDGAVVNVTGNNDAYDLWVGRREGGSGTLNINSGGVVTANKDLRVASVDSNSSVVTVDGVGSQLNIGNVAFIGNTSLEGTIGTVEVTDGGAVSINGFVRVGNQGGSTGVVNVNGVGSAMNLGSSFQVGYQGTGFASVTNGGKITAETFLHVGWTGNGSLSILDGGVVEVGTRPETTFGTFIGREDGGTGLVDIAGVNSQLMATHSVFLGAGTDLEATGGTGTLIVRDNGAAAVGGSLVARGESAVLLNNGSITVGDGSFFQDGSSLTGEGSLIGDLSIEGESFTFGTGAGILVSGSLSGNGTVENFTLGGINSVAGVGALTLRDVAFSPGAIVDIVIDDLGAENLIVFDEQTTFSGNYLVVSFGDIDPSSVVSFTLFSSAEGEGSPLDFASVTIPVGWTFEDGVLVNDNPVAASGFADWAASFDLLDDDAAPGADPDGDGFTNLQEYAFGTNPAEATPSLAETTVDGTQIVLTWNRSTEAGITYVISRSVDLVTWDPIAGAAAEATLVSEQPNLDGYERVTWSTEIGQASRAFYRVEADVDPELLP